MKKNEAERLVHETFTQSFSEERFVRFIRNLLPGLEAPSSRTVPNAQIPQGFREHVHSYTRLGTYRDMHGDVLDVVIVILKRQGSLDRARTRQRNLMAHYLKIRGKDAAIVAYIADNPADWRFSYVKLAFQTAITDKGKVQVKSEFTPARRYSFLVGENEPNHTAQKQLGNLLIKEGRLTIEQIEDAFNIESVTKEFFEDYKDLFILTKDNLDKIVVANQKLKLEFQRCEIDTANFAKKMLGQIVFLYFLQKKGWLGVAQDAAWGTGDKKFLHNLFKNNGKSNYFDEVLEPFFYEALAIERKGDIYPAMQCKVPFLNGGLFEPLNGYDWENTPINLDNQVFDEIFKVFNLYNFTVREDEPLEREVAVDPEMLGRVFESLIEENERKGLGAYYTPREIVHYMCQESLISYLDNAINQRERFLVPDHDRQAALFGTEEPYQGIFQENIHEEIIPLLDLQLFIREGETSLEIDALKEVGALTSKEYGLPESIRKNADKLEKALQDIKICDPAIGSGAFPVGMMTEIVRARRVLSPYVNDHKNRIDYEFKWHCIENSLYGVDIDSGAIEIAKLRLWLSLVVDETHYDNIRPLPNLDYKILCGNSLLGYPYQRRGLEEFEKLKERYFKETNSDKKKKMRDQIDLVLNELFKNTKKSLGYQVTVDFKINFSEVFRENDGFDVVIGNPPYVRQERIKDLKPALKKVHPDVYQGTADLYVFFYSQGTKILCPDGFLTFISSNKFMRASYGKKLRRLLSQDVTPKTVIDFGDLPVFDATTYPCIVSVQKSPLPSGNHITVLKVKAVEQIRHITEVIAQDAWQMPQQKALTVDGWRLEATEILNLLEKLRNNGTPLSEYVHGRFYRGVITGYNQAFVIDHATRERLISESPSSEEIIKPYLRGKDVKRWTLAYANQYLIKIESSQNVQHPWSGKTDNEAKKIFAETYPAINVHFQQYREQLIKRQDQGKYFWELRACAYWSEFEQTKIVWGNLATRPQFTFADEMYYVNAPANIIVSDSNYLLGILNSRVTQFLVYKNAAERAGGFLEFKPMYIAPLAIPTKPKNEKISEIVTRILDEKQANPVASISAIEADVDRLVYALYGLAEEEIAIVEESVGR